MREGWYLDGRGGGGGDGGGCLAVACRVGVAVSVVRLLQC